MGTFQDIITDTINSHINIENIKIIRVAHGDTKLIIYYEKIINGHLIEIVNDSCRDIIFAFNTIEEQINFIFKRLKTDIKYNNNRFELQYENNNYFIYLYGESIAVGWNGKTRFIISNEDFNKKIKFLFPNIYNNYEYIKSAK